jgi:hypothetical protein
MHGSVLLFTAGDIPYRAAGMLKISFTSKLCISISFMRNVIFCLKGDRVYYDITNREKVLVATRVSDPYSFDTDPDPAF